MQWDPTLWPKTLSEGCLFGIFGRLIVSARTEEARLEYALEMLDWWHDRLFNPKHADNAAWIRSATLPRMRDQDWTPAQIIEEKKRDGFSDLDYDSWNLVTQRWMGKRFRRRGLYKPKNELDALLKQRLGKKRKKERYRLLKQFIQINDGCSEEVACQIISRLQNEFNHSRTFIVSYSLPAFLNWVQDQEKLHFMERAKKAAKARWKSPNA
jgi:hypothetical protein